MNRRLFLKGIGGAALAAPFLGSVRKLVAAAPATTPIRNILFYTHNGCNTNRWFPTIEDGPLTATDLSPTLSPLAGKVEKLLIPRGFKSLNKIGGRQSIDPHNQAMGSKLTCALIEPNDQGRRNYATGISVDQEMAKQMNADGAKPLLLSVGQRSDSIREVISFSAPSEPYVSEVNPAVVYAQLTGILMSSGGQNPTGEADYRLRQGQSVLDLVEAELASFQRLNMSARDRQRVEAWAALVRETEMGLTGMQGGGDATTSCTPAFAEMMGVNETTVAAAGQGVTGNRHLVETQIGLDDLVQDPSEALKQSFTVGGDMMLKLIALSAICDMNRVMGMLYPGYVIFDWDGISHTEDHHGLSHRGGGLSFDNNCITGVMGMIQQIDEWYAGKFAMLVNLLDEIPEGDGTILDNTATIWLPELSDGNDHNLNNLPILIAGSAGGKLKQGMVVNVEGAPIGPGNSENGCNSQMNTSGFTGSERGNVPINKLYCTLMNAYGMTAPGGGEWTTFGQFDNDDPNAEDFTNPGEVSALKA
jgi:hypothetical protein